MMNVPPGASEADLLTRAWGALAANDGATALELTVRARTAYPDGALGEEREAIAIIALHRMHRDGEAKPRAAEFARKYPSSIHAPLLARELGAPPAR